MTLYYRKTIDKIDIDNIFNNYFIEDIHNCFEKNKKVLYVNLENYISDNHGMMREIIIDYGIDRSKMIYFNITGNNIEDNISEYTMINKLSRAIVFQYILDNKYIEKYTYRDTKNTYFEEHM